MGKRKNRGRFWGSYNDPQPLNVFLQNQDNEDNALWASTRTKQKTASELAAIRVQKEASNAAERAEIREDEIIDRLDHEYDEDKYFEHIQQEAAKAEKSIKTRQLFRDFVTKAVQHSKAIQHSKEEQLKVVTQESSHRHHIADIQSEKRISLFSRFKQETETKQVEIAATAEIAAIEAHIEKAAAYVKQFELKIPELETKPQPASKTEHPKPQTKLSKATEARIARRNGQPSVALPASVVVAGQPTPSSPTSGFVTVDKPSPTKGGLFTQPAATKAEQQPATASWFPKFW